MTRTDLAKALAHSIPGLAATDAEKMLAALPAIVKAELQAHGVLDIQGLARFKALDRPARTYRNPKTQAPVEKSAHRVVSVKAAKGLLAT